jgi:GntR family transcriptional regulator
MKLDPGSHIPFYLQIADGIRDAVAAGVYLPGESLPSLRALALEIHTNPNTVQKAYDELAREGLIYSRRGMGLFVAERGDASARASAQQSLQRSFVDGINAARAAGMSTREIRKAFTAAVDNTPKKKTGDAPEKGSRK